MPPATTANAWQVHHLADLTWDVSQAADRLVEPKAGVDDEHLVAFWQATRGLVNHWLRSLTEWTDAVRTTADRHLFEALAAEMLIGDMLLRVWSTLLAIQDRRAGQNNARAVLDLAIFNLQHVRHRLLAALIVDANEFAELDRLRRRCERWTDVLLGPLVVRFGLAQYAHDPRRAWDYGEDAAITSSDIADRMLRSGYQTAFDGPLGRHSLSSDDWTTIIAGIDHQVAQLLGTNWPSRWSTPSAMPEPAGLSVFVPDEEPEESAFIRGLRQLEDRRRNP